MPICPAAPAVALLMLAATVTNAGAQVTPAPAMKLFLDETQAYRRIAFVHEEIRVQPGLLSLAYPRWIPGEHGGVPTYYATASIGLLLQKDGSIYDVVPGTPAYDAGLGPSMKVVAVDGHLYSPEVLTESIAHPPNGKISLIVSNFDTVQTREIRYAGGVRNPHLEPIPGRHDYFSEILAPRAPAKH